MSGSDDRRGAGAGALGAEGREPDLERIARIVRGAPEAFFRLNGTVGSPSRLAAALTYLSRSGEITLSDQGGRPIAGERARAELALVWQADHALRLPDHSAGPIAAHVILGLPGSDAPGQVFAAAAAFAQREWAGRFAYVMAGNPDAMNPHVHLLARYRGADGAPFRFTARDLLLVRMRFAEALREVGLDAEASRRTERGVVRRSEPFRVRLLRQAYEAGEGPLPERLTAAIEAARSLDPVEPEFNPAERRALSRHAWAAERYVTLAGELERSGDPARAQLAAEIRAFVEAMAPREPRRLELARALRARTPDRGDFERSR